MIVQSDFLCALGDSVSSLFEAVAIAVSRFIIEMPGAACLTVMRRAPPVCIRAAACTITAQSKRALPPGKGIGAVVRDLL